MHSPSGTRYVWTIVPVVYSFPASSMQSAIATSLPLQAQDVYTALMDDANDRAYLGTCSSIRAGGPPSYAITLDSQHTTHSQRLRAQCLHTHTHEQTRNIQHTPYQHHLISQCTIVTHLRFCQERDRVGSHIAQSDQSLLRAARLAGVLQHRLVPRSGHAARLHGGLFHVWKCMALR